MKLVKLFLLNAGVITAAALFMRIADFSFNVYISNEIGTVGIGLFSLIMSVYSFAVTFATSGINLAVTRIISEAIGSGNNRRIRKSILCCILYSLILGLCSGTLLFLLADKIGNDILSDARTVTSLKMLAFSCVFLSVSSAFSGYFTAVRRVSKNAIVSVLEQLIRIGITVFALKNYSKGDIGNACACMCAGLVISECISFLITLIMYYSDIAKSKFVYSDDKLPVKKLLGITVPLAVSSYIRSGLVTIEHILIPIGLKKCGSSYEKALSDYGVFHGMVLPLIFFPQVFLSSFSSLLIPELTQSQAKNNKRHINYIIGRIFQITLLYSLIVAGIMICFSDIFGMSIYNNADCGKYIRYMAPLIPVMYLDNAIDTMLKGLGEQFYSMCVNIVDASISVIMVYTLVPIYSLKAYIITVYCCEVLNLALSISRLIVKTGVRFDIKKCIIMPIICVIGATSCVSFITKGFNIFISEPKLELLMLIIFSLIVYIIAVLLTGTLDKEDRLWLSNIIK